MKLKITQEQFEILYTLVRHVRLGQGTPLNDAVFKLCGMMEGIATEKQINDEWLPQLGMSYNEAEGLALEIK